MGEGGRVMQGQQFLVLIEARLSNFSYAKVQVNYIISWPGGLLTIYDPLLVTAVSQPGHLFLQG